MLHKQKLQMQKSFMSRSHLSAGFILNEGTLFKKKKKKFYKSVLQVNLHVNLGPKQTAPTWSGLPAIGLSVLGALACKLWAGCVPSWRV